MNTAEKFVMLFCVLASATTSVYAQINEQSCDPFCKDFNQFCMVLNCGIYEELCPQACGLCTRCSGDKVPCQTDGKCADRSWLPFWCTRIKQRGLCHKSGNTCLKTCGFCRDCQLPPDERCDPDCKDLKVKCPTWDIYCPRNSSFPDVADLCPKTCGACKPCRVPNDPPKGSFQNSSTPIQEDQNQEMASGDLPPMTPMTPYSKENKTEVAQREKLHDDVQ